MAKEEQAKKIDSDEMANNPNEDAGDFDFPFSEA